MNFEFHQAGQISTYKIHSTNDGNSVSEQVTTRDLVEAAQVSESRSTNLAAVGSLGAVGDDENTHLTLRGFDGTVSLAGRYGVALGVEQEVVNESLHVLLHGCAGRGSDLVVLDLDGAGGDLVEALVNDAQGLAELLHAAEVAVVAVAVDADGDVEFDLVVGIVGLGLADVPGDTGAAEHDTGERVVESIGGTDDTDTLGAADPDTVVGQKLLGLVDAVTELGGPLVDVVEKADRKILGNATGANVSGVETGTGDTLVEFLCFVSLTLFRHRHFFDVGFSHTMSFSRSSKPHRKGVRAPTSIACERTDIRWFRIRVISPNMVRIHLARSGTSMFSSFSTAREKHCSLVIMET